MFTNAGPRAAGEDAVCCKSRSLLIGIIFLILAPGVFGSCSTILEEVQPVPPMSTANTGPYLTTEENLETVKRLIDKHEEHYREILERLIKHADEWLEEGPWSVTFKDEAFYGPSNNPHDYVTLDTFTWPNPNTEDGLPYVRRDGQTNPEGANYDRQSLARLSRAVEELSLAWSLTENEVYAEHAAFLIRTWFLDEETRMNPHFRYAQFWPGVRDGGAQGIVEGRDFIHIIEGATLIYNSKAWSGRDHRDLKEWFFNFQQWIGRNYNNNSFGNSNIGTWLDAQKTIYTLFTDQTELLHNRNHLLPVEERINMQFSADGGMPTELNRHNGLFYTWFNLKGYIYQAEMRDNIITVNFEGNQADTFYKMSGSTVDASIERGLDWLLPYASGQQEWNFPQRNPFNECRFIEIYRPAALSLMRSEYEEFVQELLEDPACYNITTLLTHPPLGRAQN